MKEIGSKLKEKREENGLTIDEASEDLKVRPSQLSNLEEGKKELEEKKKEGPKITSPYTSFEQEKNKIPKLLIALVIVLLVVFGGYLIISNMSGNDFHKENVTYVIGR